MNTRPINEIASEIYQNWGSKINFAAKPYLKAMTFLDKPTDKYIHDSGREIVLLFLCNATTYRGETARRVKAELKKLLGG